MPARHRHAAREQSKQRILAEYHRQSDANGVLECRQQAREEPEQHDLHAPNAQQTEARTQSNGREERDHHRALQRCRELERKHSRLSQCERERRKQESAHHWCRNIESIENADALANAVAGEEDDCSKGNRLDHVERQRSQ